MSEDSSEIGSIANPVLMAADTITRLNKEGLRESFKPLQIVDESREAMARMPKGKTGIVLGAGQNSESWRNKGWKTLDIDLSTNADHIVDANFLEQVAPLGSQDFVLAEYVTMDPLGWEGVAHARVLQQANLALKQDGTLIIKTAHLENAPTTLPDRRKFVNDMADHGFRAVVELHQIIDDGDNVRGQAVVYYGRKEIEGYQENRLQK